MHITIVYYNKEGGVLEGSIYIEKRTMIMCLLPPANIVA